MDEFNNQSSERSRTKKSKKILAAILVVFCTLAVIFSAVFFKPVHKTALQFPAHIADGLNYPIYYPANVTNGYQYQADSEKIRNMLLFFTLTHGSKSIFVTEQPIPNSAINLSSLPKYTNLSLPIGQAVVGTGLGNPSVVIITPSTLIQLTSNKGVTKADIISIAGAMARQH